MARIHPALNTDNTFTAPTINNYSDIHEYYTYLDSFLMHEKFSGRNYKPREQLNYFLNGLNSTYAPAIARIRNQLDNWDPKDTSLPENLQLANLPNLIEKYMEEQGDGVVIRRVAKVNHRNKSTNDDVTPQTDTTARPYVDIKCSLCNSFGHANTNCDRMALWLHLKAGSKLLDEKLRLKILANYAELDAKRRSKKIGKIRGTVRLLYENGQFEEGNKLLDSAIPSKQNTTVDSTLDDSDSDASNSS
jgi:hypothetical protein